MWTVDVNQFVGPVQAKVKAATGREVVIGGGVKLALGLEPKVVFDDVRFGNASWAKDKDFASVKHVEADVALLPLLQRHFEVVRLTLVEPNISLETGTRTARRTGISGPAGPQGRRARPAPAPRRSSRRSASGRSRSRRAP